MSPISNSAPVPLGGVHSLQARENLSTSCFAGVQKLINPLYTTLHTVNSWTRIRVTQSHIPIAK
jgi:hypothetical protein